MSAIKHSSFEIISREVGRYNTDIAAGWETGLLGKKRVGNHLYERHPPEHLLEKQNNSRLADWLLGKEKAIKYKRLYMNRSIYYFAKNDKGDVNGSYKSWGIKRGEIMLKLEKQGCYGDVYFHYAEGGEIVREVKCGI